MLSTIRTNAGERNGKDCGTTRERQVAAVESLKKTIPIYYDVGRQAPGGLITHKGVCRAACESTIRYIIVFIYARQSVIPREKK